MLWSLCEQLVQLNDFPEASAAPPAEQSASVFITMEIGPPEIRLGDGDAHVLKQLQSGLYKHQILSPSKEASNNQVGENAQAEVC